MKQTLTLLIAMMLALVTKAQTNMEGPPSLSLGLSGLAFGKGMLDAELIAEIVADKQDELKKEFVQRYMLNKLDGQSYALWEFTYNSLDALLNTKDKKIIQKRLLEEAANLAMVYVFTEGYLNASRKLGNDDLFKFLKLLETIGIKKDKDFVFNNSTMNYLDNSYTNVNKIYSNLDYTCAKYEKELAHLNKESEGLINGLHFRIDSLFKKLSGIKISLDSLRKFKNINTSNVTFTSLTNTVALSSEVKLDDKGSFTLNQFLLDYFYDKLKNNEELQALGFFKSWKPLGEDYYNEHNLFKKHENILKDSTEFKDFDKRLSSEIDLIHGNYYLSEIINSTRTKTLSSALKHFSSDILSGKNLIDTAKSLSEKILAADARTPEQIAKTATDTAFTKKYAALRQDMVKFNDLLKYIQSDTALKNISISDLYFTSERIFKTAQMVNKYCSSGCVDNIIDLKSVQKILNTITAKYIGHLLEGRKAGVGEADTYIEEVYAKIKDIDIANYSVLTDLVQRMHRLNMAETYDYTLNAIKYLADNLLDKKTAPIINIITTNLEKYALVDKDANTISLKSEELIEALYNKYGETSFSVFKSYPSFKVAPYFTVGAASGYWKYRDKSDTTIFLPMDSVNGKLQPIKSLSMVSEKIGIKLMWDVKAHRVLNHDKKLQQNRSLEPFVHDWHALIYGSGILYNITSTTTEKNFEYPLAGLALGASFFNGLDVNFFYSIPIVPHENFRQSVNRRNYIGLSCDIKIVEYLAAIRKKRLQSKQADE